MIDDDTDVQALTIKAEEDLQEALANLTERQHKTVLAVISGDTKTGAMRSAGYSALSSRTLAAFDSPNVQRVLNLHRKFDQLKHGISAAWKRQELVDTYNHARRLDQTGSANATLKTLLEMDGDIKTINNIGGAGVTIIVATGIERDNGKPVTVIEGEATVVPDQPELPDFLK